MCMRTEWNIFDNRFVRELRHTTLSLWGTMVKHPFPTVRPMAPNRFVNHFCQKVSANVQQYNYRKTASDTHRRYSRYAQPRINTSYYLQKTAITPIVCHIVLHGEKIAGHGSNVCYYRGFWTTYYFFFSPFFMTSRRKYKLKWTAAFQE